MRAAAVNRARSAIIAPRRRHESTAARSPSSGLAAELAAAPAPDGRVVREVAGSPRAASRSHPREARDDCHPSAESVCALDYPAACAGVRALGSQVSSRLAPPSSCGKSFLATSGRGHGGSHASRRVLAMVTTIGMGGGHGGPSAVDTRTRGRRSDRAWKPSEVGKAYASTFPRSKSAVAPDAESWLGAAPITCSPADPARPHAAPVRRADQGSPADPAVQRADHCGAA